MKIITLFFVLAAPLLLAGCSSSNPRTENCKMSCESRARHTSDQINNCKQMCEKYNK